VNFKNMNMALERREHIYKSTGAVYMGQWSGGFRHGKGYIRWESGACYDGEW
jgi:hypothetical protein